MVEWLKIDELERIWKEAVVVCFKALFQPPRGTKEDQGRTQDSRWSGRDLNQELPEYKSEHYRLIQLPRSKYCKAVYRFIGSLYPEGWMRRATGWTAGVWFPVGARHFSLFHSVQTDCKARPDSYLMGARGTFLGGKAAGAWSWPLTSIQCRAHEWWSYTSTPHTSSWRSA
jgi:hypothetical protein